jgi:hypothetical protein
VAATPRPTVDGRPGGVDGRSGREEAKPVGPDLPAANLPAADLTETT